MKYLKCITFYFIILFLISCSPNKDKTEWNKIKDLSDFRAFFNYSIKTKDSANLKLCIDSLEKYKPSENCIILHNLYKYKPVKDSVNCSVFKQADLCNEYLEYDKDRNIVRVYINENDSLIVRCQSQDYSNLRDLLITLHNIKEVSFDVPERWSVEYENKKYYQHVIAVIICCRMLPDSLERKTSWNGLINTTKNILNAIDSVKNIKTKTIFNTQYIKLANDKKLLIDRISRTHIEIFFHLPYFNFDILESLPFDSMKDNEMKFYN